MSLGYLPSDEDLGVMLANTPHVIILYIMAGVMAGTFGFGGGMIKGPLMIEMGITPQRASATSTCMITFTSATVTVSYLVFDTYMNVIDYALVMILLGVTGSLIGQFLASRHITSGAAILYTIASVVGISTVLLTLESIRAIVLDSGKYRGNIFEFSSLCPSTSSGDA